MFDVSDELASLEGRIGKLHLRRRLDLEADHEAHVRRRSGLLHLENWQLVRHLIRTGLRITALHERGRRNALTIEVAEHVVPLPRLAQSFHGFTLLQLSDLHLGASEAAIDALIEAVRPLSFDLCVLTGDYRFRTYGPFDDALAGLRRLREAIDAPAFAVLGNHDTIRMVPAMEAMGYRCLINELTQIQRDEDVLYLAGVDDAYFYHLADLHHASDALPRDATSILLSHSPETYQHAAHAEFDLMLCGHTHGGQICLPGGRPVITHASSPRRLARGSWRFREMIGYTSRGAGNSLVEVRFNCPPEVTLHRLERAGA